MAFRGRDSRVVLDVAPSRPARRHPSYTALPAGTDVVGSSQDNQQARTAPLRSSSSTADAPVRPYQPGLRDPYAR